MCNGDLDPLIRDFPHLCEICRHDPEQIKEAGRICAISLKWAAECNTLERAQAAFDAWRAARSTPAWRKFPDRLPGIKTPAQFLAQHGNLDCRAVCADASDLARCAELVGSYNQFDAPLFVRQLAEFNRRGFHNPGNPNNGRDLFTYVFGWEGSHVTYVKFNARFGRELNAPSTHWRALTTARFQSDCHTLGEITHADENHVVEEDDERVVWRLWWD